VPPDNPFPKGPVPEIWAYGFRNPYRFSFDQEEKKDLYLGDVGQNDIEEVDLVKRGANHGWNCKEGTLFFHINGDAEGFAAREPDTSRPLCRPSVTLFIDPIAQYDTHHEGHSVIGGYVYHGRQAPSLRGKYVFGDFARVFKFPRGPHDYGRLLAIRAGEGFGLRSIRELIVLPSGDLALAVLGIGQDAAGEIYAMGNVFGVPFGNNGVLVRLVEAPSTDDEDEKDDHHGRRGKHRD
jgi:Glucose / Sorbosone dehydrogenase